MPTEITQTTEFASAAEAEAVAAQSRAAEVVAKLPRLRALLAGFLERMGMQDRLKFCTESFGKLDGFERMHGSDDLMMAVGLRVTVRAKALPPAVLNSYDYTDKYQGYYLHKLFHQRPSGPGRNSKFVPEMDFVVVYCDARKLRLVPVHVFDDLKNVLSERGYLKLDGHTPVTFLEFLKTNLPDTNVVQGIKKNIGLLVSLEATHHEHETWKSIMQSYIESLTVRGFFGPDTIFPPLALRRAVQAQKAAASDESRMKAEQGVGVAQAVEAAVQSTNLRHKPLTPAEVEQRSLDGLIHCLTHAQSTYVADLDPAVCKVVLESMVKATQAGHGGLGLRDDKVQLANFLATTRLAEVESGRGFGDLSKEIDVFLTAKALRNRTQSKCNVGDFAELVGREAPHAPLMSAALAEFSQMDALVHGLSGLLQVPPAPELPPPGTTAQALYERVASKGSYDFKERPVAPPTPQQLEVGLQVAADYVARAYDPQHPFATCAEGAQLYLELAADPAVAPFGRGRGVFGATVLATRAHPGSQEVRGAFLALAQAFLDDPRGGLDYCGTWTPPAELVLAVHAAAKAAREASQAKVSRKRGRGKKN